MRSKVTNTPCVVAFLLLRSSVAPAVSSCVRVWSASVRTKRSLAQPVQTELSPVEAPCVCGGREGGGVWGGGREDGVYMYVGGREGVCMRERGKNV